jgi:cytochrome c oxidase subunit 1
MATFGAFILGFSSIFTGLNFIVTINTMRPPGMTWFRMPLFLWATYSTSIIQVLATPVLGITLLLLIAERTMHIGIFDPNTTAIRLPTSTFSGSTATRPCTS